MELAAIEYVRSESQGLADAGERYRVKGEESEILL